MATFFKKLKNPVLGKIEFCWKKGLWQFLNIPIIYHHVKNKKKTNEQFLRKMPNRQINRGQID